MAEQARTGLSVSFRLDNGIVEHNNREFIAKNVVRERIPDNITYKRENIREFYNQLFGQALAEYNSRKAHPYQRILILSISLYTFSSKNLRCSVLE